MARTKVTQKKVSLSELNNHNVSNKRQALKDLKKLNFDELQYKNSAQKRFYKTISDKDGLVIECGPGKVLAGLGKANNCSVTNINDDFKDKIKDIYG